MKYFLLGSFLLLNSLVVSGQNKSMWATIWSCNKASKIDDIINTAKQYGFNKVFIQVRYRADALYFPNKKDSSFSNTESRCYLLKDSDFDPLQYAITKAKEAQIEIHAWVPIFVVTPHNLSKISSSHIYYTHSDWITIDEAGNKMPSNSHEGAFLDPGIPQVQEYTLNVLKDIASNYDVSGIQLDYIRYPDSLYGYNPIALEYYKSSNYSNFAEWKQSQINSFVNKAFIMLKNIDPNIQVSAAVFGNQQKSINKFSQNWKTWLSGCYIDNIYVMAYNTSDNSFKDVLQGIKDVDKTKTTIILRAWIDRGKYSVHQINNKVRISKKMGFTNFGFYSYSGLIKNNYLPHLHK